MSGVYPLVEAAIVAACLGLMLFAVAGMAATRGLWRAMAWAGPGAAWFLLVWELARSGAFEGTRGSGRLAEGTVILVSLVVGSAVLWARRKGGPSAADAAGIQAIRIVGVVVLVALAGEALPAWLALPIGVGDPLVGLTAPSVMRQVRAGPRGHAVARVWNAIGAALAVYTMAAPVAVAHSTGYFFSLYPLVLFPTFLAPSALLLHLASLKGLAPTRGASAPQ